MEHKAVVYWINQKENELEEKMAETEIEIEILQRISKVDPSMQQVVINELVKLTEMYRGYEIRQKAIELFKTERLKKFTAIKGGVVH